MFVPIWLLVLLVLFAIGAASWAFLLATNRNPLPFPDRGSRIFSAASPEAKQAIVALLGQFGVAERFQFNSSGILRSIFWDGTIINCPPEEARRKLEGASSSIGLVCTDPEASARDAVEFLRARGFEARLVPDVEPELPIAFVLTNAMPGTVLNFRKHLIHLPRPQPLRA